MIEIKTLKDLSFDEIYTAFADAFSDYESLPTEKEALRVMLKCRGFSKENSFGAFLGNRLLSFTFNGIGEHLGKKTAYDTGTGTIKEFRGQKLAGRIFEESIPHLKSAGVEQYLLEVLQHNTPAYNIYKAQGFTISREFNYYSHQVKQINTPLCKMPDGYIVKEIEIPKQEEVYTFWDFQPSWQNSMDSVNRNSENTKTLGVFKGKVMLGYGILDPNSGNINQLAIEKNSRRLKLGSILFSELVKLNNNPSVRIINTEKAYKPMEAFLENFGIPLAGFQYEMLKSI